ncbi:MAG: S8 family serine peptidase, partial [Candidatus Atribacteria bacterium]|nr:S8 family serine peptidase [Candidatus Atribacteria bacterium]
FKEKPGPAEQALVKGLGGKIKYTYNIVDAIAASIPEKAIDALQKNPNVRYVEPDGLVQALDELDDSWGVKRIGAGVVYDSGNKGTGINVAIIDTGIDRSHGDLTVVGGKSFVSYTEDFDDDNGHGTHVAGIVAAMDNGIGVVGVAPAANLYALKALDSNGSGNVSDVVMAIQWATVNEIQVINMSLGGPYSITLEAACLLAYYTDGLILVAAAGNSGNPPGKGDNISFPAGYEWVIAVAATDQSDERARWSSTGPELELSAPGVAINSTLLGGGYGEKSGTSMASPHVAGVAALVWANPANSNWTNDDVRAQLQDTADDLGSAGKDSKFGYGLVDADEAAGVKTPPSGEMHVSDIYMSWKSRGPWVNAIAKVTIVDESGTPVESATVYGHWSDATSDSDFGITDSSGTVSLKSNKVKKPSSGTAFTFTVDDVIKDGWTYDEDNSVTTASESVP